MKKLVVVLLSVLMCLTLAGCGKKDDAVVWKVGTSPDYPPFEDLQLDGTIIGFDIDMLNTLVSYLDYEVKVELVQIEFDNIVTAVQAGQVDLGLSAFSYDPERDVIFSTPYVKSAQAVVVKADAGYATVEDLAGKSVGAQSGTTGFSAAVDTFGKDFVESFPDNQLGLMSIGTQIDAYVVDYAVANAFVKANPGYMIFEEYLTEEDFSFIMKNGNTEMENTINDLIAKFLESSEYESLKAKWDV